MDNKPIISIIVPIFNIKEYIRECLLSIKYQSFTDFEVILVDDGSTDEFENNIVDILEDNRFRLYKKSNEGQSSARNLGIELSKGDYIVFIDGDDSVEPNFLYILFKNISSSKADIVCCGYNVFDCLDCKLKGKYTVFDMNGSMCCNKYNLWEHYYFSNKQESFAINVVWGKIYKKSLFFSLRFINGVLFEDEYFNFAIYDLCEKICVIPDILYNYKVNRNGSTTSSNECDSNFYLPYLLRYIFFINNKYPKRLYDLELDKFIYIYLDDYKKNRKNFSYNSNLKKYVFLLYKKNIFKRRYFYALIKTYAPFVYLLIHRKLTS